MNRKVRDILFFLIVFTLIFNSIPKPIQLNFIGGPVGGKLCVYPLLVGFLYSFWCQYKYGNVFCDVKKFLKYITVFIGVMLLSTVVGLITYPYYDVVLNGPVNQIEKLPRVLDFLHANGIEADRKILMQAWIIVRQIKGVFLNAFWLFGGAYLIYCWYKEEWKQAVCIATRAILISGGVIILYSAVEIFWLAHSDAAGRILSVVNPYIHEIETNGMWWPPLLWKNQLRSVFAEPSYYGMYMAFALPWLWYRMYQKQTWSNAAITFILTFFLILTKARTAFMLHVGELSLLILFCLLFARSKKVFIHVGKILCISLCAFLIGTGFIGQYVDVGVKKADNAVVAYIESNAASLANPEARSNKTRYSVMVADIKLGMDHPVLGVGRGLRSSYLPDYFSEKALKVEEIKMWLQFREKLGIMRSGIPTLGEYTSRFSETGTLGLGVFLAPAVFLAVSLLKKMRNSKDAFPYIIFSVSFVGMLASGIGDTLNITYCVWVLLGLGYAMVFGKEEKNEK